MKLTALSHMGRERTKGKLGLLEVFRGGAEASASDYACPAMPGGPREAYYLHSAQV